MTDNDKLIGADRYQSYDNPEKKLKTSKILSPLFCSVIFCKYIYYGFVLDSKQSCFVFCAFIRIFKKKFKGNAIDSGFFLLIFWLQAILQLYWKWKSLTIFNRKNIFQDNQQSEFIISYLALFLNSVYLANKLVDFSASLASLVCKVLFCYATEKYLTSQTLPRRSLHHDFVLN